MAIWAKAAKTPHLDWRRTADPDDLREYDAFGPWVDQVRSEIEMPKVFRSYYPQFHDAAFLLKIPRDVDRAAMRPGMDLYAAVLAVHDQGVCLLRHLGTTVTREDTSWDQVVACSTYTNLLVGHWSLLLSNGSAVQIDHNTVASATMAQITAFARSRILSDEGPTNQPELPEIPVPQDFFSSNLKHLQWTSPAPVVAIHVEPKNRLCRDSRLRRRLSTGVMIVDAPRELILVNCGEPVRRFFLANYATNVVLVPYAGLTSFEVIAASPSRARTFCLLVLRAGDQVITQPCLDQPTAAVAALEARGVPQLSLTEPSASVT
jgi:hypothetical protein